MLKSFKYRIYPNKKQEELINKHIGSTRFIYNLALETKIMAYAGYKVNLSCFDLMKQIPDLKKECTWLKEINAQSLQAVIRNLDNAFTRFYKGQSNFPKFKSKRKGVQSFNLPQRVYLKNEKLIIPKFREGINIALHRPIKGVIRRATISRTPTGKYFVSILCETGEEPKPKPKVTEEKTVGIDLGVKAFIVFSDGKHFDNPKYLRKAQSKLKYVQRKYSKHKGNRTKKKLAKLHEKIVNKRKDFLHKVSIKLIRENQTIALETLPVCNMLKNRSLAQAISDASWATFISMLEYKAEWYGVNLLRIGRFDPSSKTCSNCGSINKDLMLSDRNWTCLKCNIKHDRDINAAINIKNFALRNYLSVEYRLKNHGKLPSLGGVMTHEA